MTAEFSVSGVFFSAILVTALTAYGLSLLLRIALVRVGAYRFVWHPALFDLSLFVVLWALIANAPWPCAPG